MKKELLIAIDAGHGGKDPGAVDPEDKKQDDGVYEDELYTEESELVLKAAKMLQRIFEKRSKHQTFLIRDRDEYVSLGKRAKMANQKQADIFISIHANAAVAESANGVETLYYPKSAAGKKLADSVQKKIIKDLKARDRGIKERANLYVLKHTHMPAILLEIGFITNIKEEAKLNDDEYLFLMMNSVVDGVENYLI